MRRRNLREVSYCHYVNHNSLFNGSYEHNVSVQTCSHVILAMHRLFPLLEGSQLAQHASPDEAHGAVYSASGCLCHHGSGVLAEAAPQVMDPVDGLAPALPYSLGLSSPSRHQQREVGGMCDLSCAQHVLLALLF